jgi:hypothetical protein
MRCRRRISSRWRSRRHLALGRHDGAGYRSDSGDNSGHHGRDPGVFVVSWRGGLVGGTGRGRCLVDYECEVTYGSHSPFLGECCFDGSVTLAGIRVVVARGVEQSPEVGKKKGSGAPDWGINIGGIVRQHCRNAHHQTTAKVSFVPRRVTVRPARTNKRCAFLGSPRVFLLLGKFSPLLLGRWFGSVNSIKTCGKALMQSLQYERVEAGRSERTS